MTQPTHIDAEIEAIVQAMREKELCLCGTCSLVHADAAAAFLRTHLLAFARTVREVGRLEKKEQITHREHSKATRLSEMMENYEYLRREGFNAAISASDAAYEKFGL